jgi:hypothetical protein
VQRPDRHVGERPGVRHDPLFANLESNFSFEDVKAFFFSTVDVRGRPAVRRHNGFP